MHLLEILKLECQLIIPLLLFHLLYHKNNVTFSLLQNMSHGMGIEENIPVAAHQNDPINLERMAASAWAPTRPWLQRVSLCPSELNHV